MKIDGDRARQRGGVALYVKGWGDIQTLRWAIQAIYTIFYILVAIEFFYFFNGIINGNMSIQRPAAVEAFLPISSLLGLRYFFQTGVYDYVHPAGLTIIMGVLLSAIITRKSLCGWICPVGCISRLLETGGKKVFKNKIVVPPILDHILISLKYLLCAFFIYAVFFKMSLADVEAFINSPYNLAADAKMLQFFTGLSKTAAFVLLVLTILSFVVKNFWCRYLCPYGALLGVFSLISPLAVKRDIATCIDCENCTRGCPYQIRVHTKKSVRSAECTACLSCVSACPVDDCLTVGFLRRKKIARAVVPAALLFIILSFYMGASISGNWESGVTNDRFYQVYKIADKLEHPR